MSIRAAAPNNVTGLPDGAVGSNFIDGLFDSVDTVIAGADSLRSRFENAVENARNLIDDDDPNDNLPVGPVDIRQRVEAIPANSLIVPLLLGALAVGAVIVLTK